MSSQWIAAITRGHNSSVCLLKDGEIIFAIEEERLSRHKYDGGPYAAMLKILDYTDKLDWLVIAHTQPLGTAGRVDFTGDDVYTGLARKLGLIDQKQDIYNHPQVVDLSAVHHKLHAACAFYRSGFEEATAVVVDGAGTFINMNTNGTDETVWELESIFNCEYPSKFHTVYKHVGGRGPFASAHIEDMDASREMELDNTYELVVDDTAGITKAYEAVTQYCGWAPIEAGKTMGLFPYGEPNVNVPKIYTDGGGGDWITADRSVIVPTYPNGAVVNENRYQYLKTPQDVFDEGKDVTLLQNRRDMAYAVQTESQEQVARLIEKAVKKTGKKNVVLSGGYALNCVANYFYLDRLKDLGINIYVEPVSNDAGTAIGAALMFYHAFTENTDVKNSGKTLYLGLPYSYSEQQINDTVDKYNGKVTENVTKTDVIKLLTDRNIVTIFQGRSENGPRALGNRSILYDPTDQFGKDFVNQVKHREYFRPFAGSILKEHVHNWFDLRGMDDSPFMMYAVNCKPGVEDRIPSIIHVDGTCRIQTVTKEQNLHYYELIEEFYKATGVPILFNTSFNLGGEPLVETLDDAIRTLANSDMEYLYLPEYNKLIYIRNISE